MMKFKNQLQNKLAMGYWFSEICSGVENQCPISVKEQEQEKQHKYKKYSCDWS